MESLFTIESAINSSKKNYMVWSGTEDDSLFSRIMRCGLKLDGLINEKFKGLSLYNLRFYAEDELEKNNSNIIRDDTCIVINSRLAGQDICIWGAGKIGVSVYQYLKRKGYHIKSVCDKDASKQGEKLEGDICITDPYDLAKFSGVVILSGIYYREMYEQAMDINPDLTCLYHDYFLEGKIHIGISGGVTVTTGYQLNYLCTYLKDKNIFIVGDKQLYEEIREFLSYFDLCVREFLDDLYEILYKENYYVIIAGNEYQQYIMKLCEIGLNLVEDFMPFGCIGDNLYPMRKNILDTNLGYTVANDNNNVGRDIYKAKREEKYKIAVLGGSTTDGTLYTFKSWPEILHGMLDDNTVTITNYGIAGYNSGMEFIKLVRDVLYSKPDVVLAFDGVNDYASVEYGVKNPIGFGYLNSVMKYISEKNDQEMFGGVEFEDLTPYSRWIRNVDMMNAVLELNQIFFMDFLQPMLASKKNKTREEELLECMVSVNIPEAKSFREYYMEEKKREYITDLSDIFDHCENIFLDYAHVNEAGNEVIATQIYGYLKNKIMRSTDANVCRLEGMLKR